MAADSSPVVPAGLRTALLPVKQRRKEHRELVALLWAVHKSSHMLAWYIASGLAQLCGLADQLGRNIAEREVETVEKLSRSLEMTPAELCYFTLTADLLRFAEFGELETIMGMEGSGAEHGDLPCLQSRGGPGILKAALHCWSSDRFRKEDIQEPVPLSVERFEVHRLAALFLLAVMQALTLCNSTAHDLLYRMGRGFEQVCMAAAARLSFPASVLEGLGKQEKRKDLWAQARGWFVDDLADPWTLVVPRDQNLFEASNVEEEPAGHDRDLQIMGPAFEAIKAAAKSGNPLQHISAALLAKGVSHFLARSPAAAQANAAWIIGNGLPHLCRLQKLTQEDGSCVPLLALLLILSRPSKAEQPAAAAADLRLLLAQSKVVHSIAITYLSSKSISTSSRKSWAAGGKLVRREKLRRLRCCAAALADCWINEEAAKQLLAVAALPKAVVDQHAACLFEVYNALKAVPAKTAVQDYSTMLSLLTLVIRPPHMLPENQRGHLAKLPAVLREACRLCSSGDETDCKILRKTAYMTLHRASFAHMNANAKQPWTSEDLPRICSFMFASAKAEGEAAGEKHKTILEHLAVELSTLKTTSNLLRLEHLDAELAHGGPGRDITVWDLLWRFVGSQYFAVPPRLSLMAWLCRTAESGVLVDLRGAKQPSGRQHGGRKFQGTAREHICIMQLLLDALKPVADKGAQQEQNLEATPAAYLKHRETIGSAVEWVFTVLSHQPDLGPASLHQEYTTIKRRLFIALCSALRPACHLTVSSATQREERQTYFVKLLFAMMILGGMAPCMTGKDTNANAYTINGVRVAFPRCSFRDVSELSGILDDVATCCHCAVEDDAPKWEGSAVGTLAAAGAGSVLAVLEHWLARSAPESKAKADLAITTLPFQRRQLLGSAIAKAARLAVNTEPGATLAALGGFSQLKWAHNVLKMMAGMLHQSKVPEIPSGFEMGLVEACWVLEEATGSSSPALSSTMSLMAWASQLALVAPTDHNPGVLEGCRNAWSSLLAKRSADLTKEVQSGIKSLLQHLEAPRNADAVMEELLKDEAEEARKLAQKADAKKAKKKAKQRARPASSTTREPTLESASEAASETAPNSDGEAETPLAMQSGEISAAIDAAAASRQPASSSGQAGGPVLVNGEAKQDTAFGDEGGDSAWQQSTSKKKRSSKKKRQAEPAAAVSSIPVRPSSAPAEGVASPGSTRPAVAAATADAPGPPRLPEGLPALPPGRPSQPEPRSAPPDSGQPPQQPAVSTSPGVGEEATWQQALGVVLPSSALSQARAKVRQLIQPFAAPEPARAIQPPPAVYVPSVGASVHTSSVFSDDEEESTISARSAARYLNQPQAMMQLPPDGRGERRLHAPPSQVSGWGSQVSTPPPQHSVYDEDGLEDEPDQEAWESNPSPRQGSASSSATYNRLHPVGMAQRRLSLGSVVPGGGGHGRAALQRGLQNPVAVPGGGGHGGPRAGPPSAGQPRAPGRLFSAERLEELCTCPITQELLEDPVVAKDGFTYERAAIEEWIQRKGTSPMTDRPLTISDLQPNLMVRHVVESVFREG